MVSSGSSSVVVGELENRSEHRSVVCILTQTPSPHTTAGHRGGICTFACMRIHSLLTFCPASGTPHTVCRRVKSSGPIGLLFVGFGAAVKGHSSHVDTSFSTVLMLHAH